MRSEEGEGWLLSSRFEAGEGVESFHMCGKKDQENDGSQAGCCTPVTLVLR